MGSMNLIEAKKNLLSYVTLLIESEEEIRRGVKHNILGLPFNPNYGLCYQVDGIHRKCFQVLSGINRKISKDTKNSTRAYPVPAPGDNPTKADAEDMYEYCLAPLHSKLIWCEGEYADNRWEYVRKVKCILEKELSSNG